jgi:hypothetical protein
MKMKNVIRYIVTDVVSIPVIRLGKKGDAYKYATKPGWGVVELYSAIDDYRFPVNRDSGDKTQVMYCDEDTSAIIYSRYGLEFVISPYEKINIKDAPSQSETEVITINNSGGFEFWEKHDGDVKIFVTYDENGLIDTYRFENWTGEPYDGETEISFHDLQSEEDFEKTKREDIIGTYEHESHKKNKNSVI